MSIITYRVCDACKDAVPEGPTTGEWSSFVTRPNTKNETTFDLCPACGSKVEDVIVELAKANADTAAGEHGDGR